MDGGAVQKLGATKNLAQNNQDFGARQHIKLTFSPNHAVVASILPLGKYTCIGRAAKC